MAETVLEYLYPEISNLYGDPFNIKYLVKCLEVNNATAVLNDDGTFPGTCNRKAHALS